MLYHHRKNKLRTAIASAILIGMGALLPMEQAYAASAGMQWNTQKSFNLPEPVHELYKSLDADKIYVNNNLGGAVALIKLSAKQVAMLQKGGDAFDMSWNSPVVFANYDPQSYTGTIFVVRLIRLPSGQGLIEMAQFTPAMGNIYKADFEGTNPFWQFIPGQNGNGAGPNAGSFVSITPAAFNTAVGLVMQHAQSGIGWIAAADTTSHMSTSSSSDFFTTTVTHKETANTKPVWTAVLPEGAAPGEQAGYLLPVPSTLEGTQQAAVASLEVGAQDDAHNVGQVTNAVAQMNDGYVGQLGVSGGYVYVPAGQGSTLPVGAFQSFFHSTSKTGINGIVFDLIMAAVTAGAGSALGLIGGTISEEAEVGAVAGFVTGMIYDVASQGTLGFTTIQDHLIGGNCGKHNHACTFGNAPTTMNAAYTAAQAFDGMQEGYVNQDTNPTQQTGQWDYVPQSSQEVEQSPGTVQGGFGQGYNENTIKPDEAAKGETLEQLGSQGTKNSSGYYNFGQNNISGLPSGSPE
ncbi:hypothetical protein [Acidithiobacillus thiooxidans]|uniref:Uncharacterized protein n=1 Tax=Acidithiobacillus thiooxidans ATCC 19377 TaxID=637390 RepID=A0A543Q1X5_ACITH|nr:hypothetical protein [Acidithiobacillus thiooxidans]TQN50334.1 hypothetical protein DLNHIDIE_00187 [Acidithiobacillus thiooxidans ATCC 19377]